MSNNNNNNTSLKKEQLLACLQHDDIQVTQETMTKVLEKDGVTLHNIRLEYHMKTKDYAKAMAWYELAANQNHIRTYNNIVYLYTNGLKVIQDHEIAMEYYLNGAAINNYIAMGNIGNQFLCGQGVPLDKYKALEWFFKGGNKPEQIEKLNKEGIHLKE